MYWFYYVVKTLVGMILRLFTRWQVKGTENIPNQGPLVVVANHLNLADPPVLAASLTRKVNFMAKKELFQSKLLSPFISSFGAFPVHRGQIDRKALSEAKKLLTEGSALAMFPEGGRSKDAKLRPGFPGSAMVALQSGAPILPVGLSGTEKIKGLKWLLRRPRLTVNIGTPFRLPAVNGKPTRTDLVRLTKLIMKQISDLLPKEYQGNHHEETGEKDVTKGRKSS